MLLNEPISSTCKSLKSALPPMLLNEPKFFICEPLKSASPNIILYGTVVN